MKNQFVLEQGLYICFGIALIATGGSLYLSDVVGYPPCTYCWYQRILMYPLVILFGMAAVRKDYAQIRYTLPFSILGAAMSLFHYLTQKTSFFKSAGKSCGIIPCDIDYLDWFGFITIPFLALIAFVMIMVMQLWIWQASKERIE